MKMINKNPETKKPWYQEPWPWLLMLGPAFVVIAGIHMLIVSLNMNHDLVVDDYYKEGQGIHLNQDKIKAAQAAKLQADLFVAADGTKMRLLLQGDWAESPSLVLSLFHPLEQRYDVTLTLPAPSNTATGEANAVATYEFALPPLPTTKRWYVRLEDNANTWQLTGQWFPANTDAPVRLIPQ